jgi:hypothetical protein
MAKLAPFAVGCALAVLGCANGGDDGASGGDAATFDGTTPTDGGSSDGVAPSDAASDADGDAIVDPYPDPITETLVGTDVPPARVGILYSVWHAPAATEQAAILSDGGTPLSMEDVLTSGGALSYADIYQRWGGEAAAMSLYYMTRPALGYYCIYEARDGGAGYVPDCPNIRATLTTHAEQLLGAGVDHVVVDDTNLTSDDEAGDLLQLRPTQVLFAEWAALRAAGQKTPQIAVWNAIPTGATQWQDYLTLYDDPANDGLVLHDAATGKKVFFVVDSGSADASIIAQIEADHGANDIEVQRMWTLSSTDASVDRWAFMSYCQSGGADTTTLVGLPTCNQPYTPASTLGSAIAVSPSFQTGYGSLPWGSPGKLEGLTFRLEWGTALTVMPKTVFVSGWNEFVAQPQPNPYSSDPFALSMGLERDPGGTNLFVDTFGEEFARDIEPTEQYGTKYYDLLASCVRVFRANQAAGTTGCNATAETCCDASGASTYVNVYALHDDAANDSLLTNSAAEQTMLLAGSGWRKVCARFGTPSAFCVDANEPSTPFGPFLAFAQMGTGRQPLYRCNVGTGHFYSLDAACEGQTVDGVLAYLAKTESSEMPRRVERCYNPTTGEHIEALGVACPAGDNDEGTLGYVR